MSTNYIHSEASKEQSLWDDLANYYEEVTDVSAVDAVDIGALFSATSTTIGSAIANSKEGKVATILVTGAKGTTLNYGVNLSKDPESGHTKALITGAATTTISVAAELLLPTILRYVGVSAIALASAPVSVAVGTVLASYSIAKIASPYVSELYDQIIGEEVNIKKTSSDQTIVETTQTPQEFFESGISEILDKTADVVIKTYYEISQSADAIEEYVIEAGSEVWQTLEQYGQSFTNFIDEGITSISDFVESLFDFATLYDQINKIETENFNNLTEEEQARLTAEGVYPIFLLWNGDMKKITNNTSYKNSIKKVS